MKKAPLVLVTGGPTKAFLDEVRYISNYSTGEVAYLLCQELKKRGFSVVAAIGPSAFPFEGLKLKALVRVETQTEMHQAVMGLCRKYKPTVGVFSAAVLDFAPKRIVKGKTSSSKKKWNITLVPTKKIIDEVGTKNPNMLRIGFKLESKLRHGTSRDKFAQSYLNKKGLQGLFLNFLSQVSSQNHQGYFYSPTGKPIVLKTKKQIASVIARAAHGPWQS